MSSVHSAHPAQPLVSIEHISPLTKVCFTHTRVQAVAKLSLGSESFNQMKIYVIMFML